VRLNSGAQQLKDVSNTAGAPAGFSTVPLTMPVDPTAGVLPWKAVAPDGGLKPAMSWHEARRQAARIASTQVRMI
jgi:hypothetical protein